MQLPTQCSRPHRMRQLCGGEPRSNSIQVGQGFSYNQMVADAISISKLIIHQEASTLVLPDARLTMSDGMYVCCRSMTACQTLW